MSARVSRSVWPAVALLLIVSVPTAAAAVRLRPAGVIYADSKGQGLQRPEGVGCAVDRLVVSDTGNGRLVFYDVTPGEVIPTAEITLSQVSSPTRIRIDREGDLLVLDGGRRRIARLGAAGSFKGYVDPVGASGDRTIVPRSLDVAADGNLLVLDLFSGRVLELDGGGNVRREIGFPAPERYGSLSDVAVSSNGVVYAVDSVAARVLSAGPGDTELAELSGSLREELDFPTSLATDPAGRLYLADEHGSGIVILGRDGSFRGRQSGMGWRTGFLRYPAALCVMPDGGSLFVADRENDRVQRFVIAE